MAVTTTRTCSRKSGASILPLSRFVTTAATTPSDQYVGIVFGAGACNISMVAADNTEYMHSVSCPRYKMTAACGRYISASVLYVATNRAT